jgi:hypothetical protein
VYVYVYVQCEFLCMARCTVLRRVPDGRCAAVLGDEKALLPVSGSVRRALLGRPDALGKAILLFAFACWSACDECVERLLRLRDEHPLRSVDSALSVENVQEETVGCCALRHEARHTEQTQWQQKQR